jgi:hypothetical protein
MTQEQIDAFELALDQLKLTHKYLSDCESIINRKGSPYPNRLTEAIEKVEACLRGPLADYLPVEQRITTFEQAVAFIKQEHDRCITEAQADGVLWRMPEPPEGKLWCSAIWSRESLPYPYRPLLNGEVWQTGDEYLNTLGKWIALEENMNRAVADNTTRPCRTTRPLP